MKHGIILLAMVCIVSSVGTTLADTWHTPETYTYTQPAAEPTRTVIVGVTLGNNWAGFPDVLMPNYKVPNTGDPRFRLDVDLPLYVNWIMDYDHATQTGTPQYVNPPVAITSYSWFSGHHGEFFVAQALVAGQWNDFGYHTCAQGDGLEAPVECTDGPCDVWGPFPMASDGKLRVNDVHGGIGRQTRIHLQRLADNQRESYNIILGWDHPGAWWDVYLDQGRELTPGMIRTDRFIVYHGGAQVGSWYESRIVAWASADFGIPFAFSTGPSPRVVDGSDLSLLSTMLGQTVRYGLNTESPPWSPTWQCNVMPFDGAPTIDISDLTLFAYWLGNNSCELSKTSPDEKAAILSWFGIAPTGRLVEMGGMSLPEYNVVDWEKNSRAVADPYGYRSNRNAAEENTSWGLVKERYR